MATKKKLKAKIIYEGKPKRKVPILPIILAILIIAILTLGYFSQWTFFLNEEATNNNILVTIDGNQITQAQLEEQWNSLPVVAKMQMTKDQLLTELIQEELLLMEANKKNITVTEKEVEQFINIQLTQLGMTYEDFENALVAQGTTTEEMKEIYKKQLIVAKLFDSTINQSLNATSEEIKNYYENNKESFFREEQVRVKHILVEMNEEFNETQAQKRVDLIVEKLDKENNENFCELVSNYSSDFGSTNNCGEYTFGKGQMAEEFEEAGFNMTAGERRVVKTIHGYHIMLKIEDITSKHLDLNDSINGVQGGTTLAEGIEQIVIEEKAQKIFYEYIAKLEEKANITYLNPLEEENVDEELLNLQNITTGIK